MTFTNCHNHANSVSPTKKGKLSPPAPIGTKLLLNISWKLSKISCERNMNMMFDCWRIPESKIANELAIVGCEIMLLLFFFFCKYLVIKNVFQVTENEKASHGDRAPLIFCNADIIVVNKAVIGDLLSAVTFHARTPSSSHALRWTPASPRTVKCLRWSPLGLLLINFKSRFHPHTT